MRGPAAFLAAWGGAPPRDVAPAGDGPSARLLEAPARAPETRIERVLMDMLASHGPLSRPVLVTQAALALYRQELAHDGGLADIGIFGEGLSVRDVIRALERRDGDGVLAAELTREEYRDLDLRVGEAAFVRPRALRVYVNEDS